MCQITYLYIKYNYGCFKLSNLTSNSIHSTSFFLAFTIKHHKSPHVLQPLSSCMCVVFVLKHTGQPVARVTWGWQIAGLVGQCVWRRRGDLTFADRT